MDTAHGLDEGDFVAFLKAAMEAAGIPTGARLAEAADLSPSMVNKWLNGKSLPSIEALRSISVPLGLEPRELWVRAGHMSRAEVGLDDEPAAPTGRHTLEDEIRMDTRIRDSQKEPLIEFLRTLIQEDSTDGTNVRNDRSA